MNASIDMAARPGMKQRRGAKTLIIAGTMVLGAAAINAAPQSRHNAPAPSVLTGTPAPLPAPAPTAPVVPDAPAAPEQSAAPAAPAGMPAPPLAPAAPAAANFAAVTAPPEDPRLAGVYAAFQAACAQCHQSGRLIRPAPAAGLANILDLPALAREPHLVRPGLPDASRLYQVLIDRHRPAELGLAANWPDADTIQRVRTWIEETPPRATTCQRITDADVGAAIDGAAQSAGEAEARELRFVSLAHLANACASPAEMEAYRQGIAKLLNSLSWGSRPIVPVAVDTAKSILAFKLSDIGWIDEHWSALARAEPRAIARDLTGLVSAPGANARPIRGDWMAWTASQPPFYAELLAIPATIDETARLLGIKRDGELATARASRAALRLSAITHGPRVIEAHHAEGRGLWLAYDFQDGAGERDVFERPLGGLKGVPDQAQFRADGQRMMFTLPNGFLAFAIQSVDGHRIDALPPRLDLEGSRVIGQATAGLSCMGCHTAGPKPFTDSMRAQLASEKFTGSHEVKELALQVYQTGNEWLPVFDEDGFRYRRALIQAGVDPDLTIGGLEPLTALARRYGLSVDLATAAAEAGMTPVEFEGRIASTSLDDPTLVPRLRQETLSRADVNKILAAIRPPNAGDQQAGLAGAPAVDAAFRLALWTDRVIYKAGDLVTIFAQPSQACHLTLISVNGTGKATVLFPNEFDPDNLVTPDLPVTVPSASAQYQFRFKDKGAETLIATCQTVAPNPAGIEPDYERQRFTSLGSFENFLRMSYGLDTDAARAAQRAATEKSHAAGKPAAAGGKPEPVKPEQTARTAVRVTIE